MTRTTVGWSLVLVVAWVASAVGCRHEPNRHELSVFAASSLSEAFSDLAQEFESRHPEIDVTLTLAGSQVLRFQLEQGAHGDVFASANREHMRALTAGGFVREARVFTVNELTVVVPKDNPARIHSFEDLDRASRLVIGSDNVPAGVYARQVLERARAKLGEDFVTRVRKRLVSEESNVRMARAKVALGEADAAFVYRTDALASKQVDVVPIPKDLNVQASYPIGIVAGTQRAPWARKFVSFVVSDAGQSVLERHGFARVAR